MNMQTTLMRLLFICLMASQSICAMDQKKQSKLGLLPFIQPNTDFLQPIQKIKIKNSITEKIVVDEINKKKNEYYNKVKELANIDNNEWYMVLKSVQSAIRNISHGIYNEQNITFHNDIPPHICNAIKKIFKKYTISIPVTVRYGTEEELNPYIVAQTITMLTGAKYDPKKLFSCDQVTVQLLLSRPYYPINTLLPFAQHTLEHETIHIKKLHGIRQIFIADKYLKEHKKLAQEKLTECLHFLYQAHELEADFLPIKNYSSALNAQKWFNKEDIPIPCCTTSENKNVHVLPQDGLKFTNSIILLHEYEIKKNMITLSSTIHNII